MIKKRVLIFCLCGAMSLLLTGCANGRVESTVSQVVSKAGEGLDNAVSHIEDGVDSMLDGDRDLDSGWDSGPEGSYDFASGVNSYGPEEWVSEWEESGLPDANGHSSAESGDSQQER